jgi:competence protein ComEC
LLETRHHSLIYDFGPGNDSGFSAGNWVLKPYMQYRGIDKADLMIVSHVDQDHSGGFISFVDDLDFSRLLSGTPKALAERFKLKSSVRSCHDFPEWHWDGVGFEFLSADSTNTYSATNDRSCVLLIKARHTILLSGDIEADQENRLLSQMPDKLKADGLLAPHHGSLTSSTEAFVKRVSPRIVVFTLSRDNRWGFPKDEVVSRYQNIGSQIYRSDLHGAVTLSSDTEGLAVESFRQKSNRLWQ